MKYYLTTILMLALVGCGQQGTDEAIGALEMTEDEGMVSGTYYLEDQELAFESTVIEAGLVELELVLNGMVLEGVIDMNEGVSSLDGYTAGTGEDTQLIEDDRALLESFYRALNEYWPGNDIPLESSSLRRATSIWAQSSPAIDLTRTVMGEEGRGYTMLCNYARCNPNSWTGACSYWNWYSYGDHDGWWHDNNDSGSQQRVQMGDHYNCSGDTYYWTGSTWACGEPDHWSRPYEMGICFGRVGGSCGGDTQYTKDGVDHDGCVRNGHVLLSSWCSDEFSYAADDELYAPNCY